MGGSSTFYRTTINNRTGGMFGLCASVSNAKLTFDESTCISVYGGISASQGTNGSSTMIVRNSILTVGYGDFDMAHTALGGSTGTGGSVNISATGNVIYVGAITGSTGTGGTVSLDISKNTIYAGNSGVSGSTGTNGAINMSLSDNHFIALRTSTFSGQLSAVRGSTGTGGIITINDDSSGRGNYICNDPSLVVVFSNVLSKSSGTGGAVIGSFFAAGTINGGETISTCP